MMNEELNRGRKIVVIIIIVTIVTSLLSIILSNIFTGSGKLLQQAIRFIFILVLSYFLFKGVGAARIIAIVLYTIGAIGGILGGISLIVKSPIGLMVLFPGIVHAICAVVLYFSVSVRQFFR
jgi:hypothetical protein